MLLLFENVLSLLMLELVSNSRGNKYPTRVISTWFIDRKDYLPNYQPRSRPLSLWKQGIKPLKETKIQSLELTSRLIGKHLYFQYPGPWRCIVDSLHNRVCRLEDTAETTNHSISCKVNSTEWDDDMHMSDYDFTSKIFLLFVLFVSFLIHFPPPRMLNKGR